MRAARSPGLHGALLAAKAAGYGHVTIDGTLIETDRCRTPGPTPGVDLWWSGKHAQHGGNVQVVTAPDGWPIWTSQVRPGREHDTTAVRTHPEILPTIIEAAGDLRTLGDLGYEGESATITVAFKKAQGRPAHTAPATTQPGPQRRTRDRRTRQRPAQRHVQSTPQRQSLPWRIGTVVLMTAMTAADLDFDITVLSDGCFDSRSRVHDMLMSDIFPAMATVATADEWLTGLVSR